MEFLPAAWNAVWNEKSKRLVLERPTPTAARYACLSMLKQKLAE